MFEASGLESTFRYAHAHITEASAWIQHDELSEITDSEVMHELGRVI